MADNTAIELAAAQIPARFIARSASDRTEVWPFWFVADMTVGGLNVTHEIAQHLGLPLGAGQVLVSPDDAKALAAKANAGIPENWTRFTSAPLKSTLRGVATRTGGAQ